MEINKILSASWLDILFDNRNKAYGAYELRKTYEKRIIKSLLVTALLAIFILVASSFSHSSKNNIILTGKNMDSVLLTEIQERTLKEPEPEIIKEKPAAQPQQVRTEIFTEFRPVPDITVIDKPPSQDDLRNTKISDVKADGPDFANIATPPQHIGNGTGIGLTKEDEDSNEPRLIVEVQAKYIGNWTKFLLRYLDPEVPAAHNAPPGRYTILIQFVVDKEGNVSDIKPLTHIGYGMEEEAIRVIKKATKWEPAIQNGFKVKAYRQQPIIFEVLEDY